MLQDVYLFALLYGEVFLLCLSGLFCFAFSQHTTVSNFDSKRAVRHRRIFLTSCLLFLLFFYVTRETYKYLEAHASHILTLFGYFYLLGLVSQILVLIVRKEILSPMFKTDWEEVSLLFIKALAGPYNTYTLLYDLLTGRHKV